MGIKEFFKKLLHEEAEKDSEESNGASGQVGADEKTKILGLKDLSIFIDEQKSVINEDKKKILLGVRQNVQRFIVEAGEEVNRLRILDLDRRKEEQRLKNIVIENFNLYLGHLEKLLGSLSDLETDDLEQYFSRINYLFVKFDSESGMNFEKATVLYGQDLKDIKFKISSFLSEFKKIKQENKNVLEKDSVLAQVQKFIEEINFTDDLKKKSGDLIVKLESDIQDLNIEAENLNGNLSAFMAGEEYKEEVQKKEIIEAEKQEVKKSAQEIKQKIDFKALLKKYHKDGKKYNLIKEYSDNFRDSLEQDFELSILKITNEDYPALTGEIRKLREKIQELSAVRNFKIENRMREIEKEVERVKIQIGNNEREIEFENKKIERFDLRTQEVIKQIQEKMGNAFSNVGVEI